MSVNGFGWLVGFVIFLFTLLFPKVTGQVLKTRTVFTDNAMPSLLRQ